jgi:hypothetical protein
VIEHGIDKVEVQPLVHDATFIDPATDDAGAEGFVMVVYCPTPPSDGDTAVYVAANNRFELRSGGAGAPVTISDGMGGFELVFDSAGNVVYA